MSLIFGLEHGKTRPNARPRSHNYDPLEEVGCVEEFMGRIPAGPQLFRQVHNHRLGPITSGFWSVQLFQALAKPLWISSPDDVKDSSCG